MSEVNGSNEGLLWLSIADEDVVNRSADLTLFDADSAGRIALRITVDQKGLLFGGGEAGRKVYRGRRLTDSALLIGYRDDSAERQLRIRGGGGGSELIAPNIACPAIVRMESGRNVGNSRFHVELLWKIVPRGTKQQSGVNAPNRE